MNDTPHEIYGVSVDPPKLEVHERPKEIYGHSVVPAPKYVAPERPEREYPPVPPNEVASRTVGEFKTRLLAQLEGVPDDTPISILFDSDFGWSGKIAVYGIGREGDFVMSITEGQH
jgi:hypothetical protein